MKLPKKINILGVEYKVIKPRHIHEDITKRRPEDEIIGLSNPSQRSISVSTNPKVCDDLKEQTFFHECTHAILYDSGLDELISPENEETFAQIFGNAMHQIYKQLKV